MHTETDVIRRNSISQMVDAYNEASRELKEGFQLIANAEARLKAAFDNRLGFDAINRHDSSISEERYDCAMKRIKSEAWKAFADKLELRRVLCTSRARELDDQLRKPESLPEITVENLLGMFESMACNFEMYLDEAVKEVFNYLRPPRSGYVTNTEFEIGRRVILSSVVERWGGHRPFRVRYYRQQDLRNLDNVFSLLDGQGAIKTYCGPLHDAIAATNGDGRGETPYFKFRCFINGNLHLEFKRPDLVEKMNAIAGGMNLKGGRAP